MGNPLLSGSVFKPKKKLAPPKAKKPSSSSNPLFGGGAAGGVPIGIANPSYMGPVLSGGADLSQFPSSANYNWHNGVGTVPGMTPNTDPVGAYTYSQQSPNDLLSQINSLYGAKSPDFTGEAKKQAATIFAPVLKDLTNQGKQAGKRTTQNDAQLKSMYAALQGSIAADGTALAKQTTKNVSGIKTLGKQGSQAIGANYDSAMADAASTMAKLGIQAAAPEALPRGAEHEALLQGLMGMNTQGAANLAQQLGANAGNFNVQQKSIAGFEGAENRNLNKQHLQDIMAGLASQRAQVGSQQASQAAGFSQNLQNQYLNSVNQKASALTQMYAQQQQAAMQQQQMQQQTALEVMKMQQAGQPSAYQQWEMTPSADKLAAYAGKLFGTGGNEASSALNFVMSAGNNSSPNALAFADSVVKSALTSGDPAIHSMNPNQLRALAMQAYSQMNVNPNIMNYQR